MLITFAGLPGSGKSSTARALAQVLQAQVFLEPEEGEWPALVHQRAVSGAFTAMSWFRTVRVPGLFEAQALSSQGKTAIVDSYFDKLTALVLEKSSFSWLVPASDPYFSVAREMAAMDYALLPNADILVFLKIEKHTWFDFMRARGRSFDQSVELTAFFDMQDDIEQACRTLAADHKIRLCVIEQSHSSALDTANLILRALALPD